MAPNIEEGPKRMKSMSRVCEQWSLEELVEMDVGDMQRLLSYYKPDMVPTFEEVRLGEGKEDGVVWEFDGSLMGVSGGRYDCVKTSTQIPVLRKASDMYNCMRDEGVSYCIFAARDL